MKIFQYIKSHLLISFILLLVIMSIIMLPIYFLVINKSGSQSPAQTPESLIHNIDPNQLGFMGFASTNDAIWFQELSSFYDDSSVKRFPDNGIGNAYYEIQYKWIYDKNNIYTIETTILNTNNAYSEAELSALGKTSKPNTYLVNQNIPRFNINNPTFFKEDTIALDQSFIPLILTSYENYKKLLKDGNYKNNIPK